jgi:hypothetical protein
MADKIQLPPEAPGSASEAAGSEGAPKFGLPAAMALIVGSIIGVGIFSLPTWAPFFLAGGALALGIPVCLAQRRHLTPPAPVPPYR